MTKLVIASVIAMCFATGFTCSKNAPEQTAQPAAPAEQAQMAAPADASAPVSGDVTAPAATSAPTETK